MISKKSRIMILMSLLLISPSFQKDKRGGHHGAGEEGDDQNDGKPMDVALEPENDKNVSEDLVKNGYKVLLASHVSEMPFDKDSYDHKSESEILMYGKSANGSSEEPVIFNDFVYELKATTKVYTLGKDMSKTLNQTVSSDGNYIELDHSLFSVFEIDSNVFTVYLEVEQNDCLGMFAYLSTEKTSPTVKIDTELNRVNLNFGDKGSPMMRGESLVAYPHKTYDGFIRVHQAIDNDVPNYLHLFCPFWVNGATPSAKMYVKKKMVSELKLNFGKWQNISSESHIWEYVKIEKIHSLKSIFYKIFAENYGNMIILKLEILQNQNILHDY